MENSQGHTSRSTAVPQPEALGLPDSELEATEPLQHQSERSPLKGSHGPYAGGELNKKSKLPWWKTPSPWWLLMTMPFTAIATSSTLAPRIEIYTTLACSIHRPDIFRGSSQQQDILDFVQQSNDHRTPAVAHQSGSVDIFGVFIIEESIQSNDADTPPTRKQRCASDPIVQAAVAKLSTVIAASMGILSCITTAWWGAFSDRHGRTSVMGISAIGLLLTDFNFIMVTLFSKHIPGGYWFLVVGPMVEGALGGTFGGVAAIHGYLADTSSESNRSRIFSLNLGLMFTGMALGPIVGSLLVRFTGQALSVFYLGGTLHLLYSCLVWFIMPESLTKNHMGLAKARYADEPHRVPLDHGRSLVAGFLNKAQRLFAFLRPLTIFGPIEEVNGNPLKAPRKDWDLTFLAIAYGFTVALMGSFSYIFQYAASTFRWSTETLGYWLSLVVGIRAIFLALILPIAIKILKPKPLVLELPVAPTETTSLLNSPSSSSSTLTTRQTIKKEIHSPLFDLNLARVSLLIDVAAYASMGLSQSPILFALFGSLGALGVGFNPAIQSVALALYARRGGTEIGKLFGAISLIQAISSQILGPFIYGVVYIKTVAIYPRMVFFVSVAAVSISFCLLSLVRIPKDDKYHRQSLADLEEPGSNEESSTSRVQESTLNT
ncbi:MFS general substrate transporter [Phlegmacium glaucopus]|nr:MFS general substrate transporter [Phlegmacium glaucopus]